MPDKTGIEWTDATPMVDRGGTRVRFYKRQNPSRPGQQLRRQMAGLGLKWCRGCRAWLPANAVTKNGLCRPHENADYRSRYASGLKRSIAARAHARKRGIAPLSVRDQELLLDQFSGRCAYCPALADTWDHIVPVSQGGEANRPHPRRPHLGSVPHPPLPRKDSSVSIAEAPTRIAGIDTGDTVAWMEGAEPCQDVVRAVDQNGVTTSRRRLGWDTPGLRRVGTAIAPAEAPAQELSTPLTEKERDQFQRCEAVIREGLRTFHAVGNALLTIRDGKLYREQHGTFETYLKEVWNISRARGYELMNAAQTYGVLSATADILPESERQVRPLTRLEPDQQPEAWKRAQELAGPGTLPTAEQVAQAVDEVKYDYWNFEPGDRIWWKESGTENLRAGRIEKLWQGRLMTRATDGGGPEDLVALLPGDVHEGEPPSAPTPFGKCPCGQAATSPAEHRRQGVTEGDPLCPGCLSARAAEQRTAQLAAAAGVPELTGALQTAAGLTPAAPEPDPVEEVPAGSMSAADNAAAARQEPVKTAAQIAEERAAQRTAASKPGVLKSAEEKVAERTGAAAEPPKPAPVSFPILPDMVERLKKAGVGALPALRFGCFLAELAQQHGTAPQILLKDLEVALTVCAAEGRQLAAVVAKGIEALDREAMAEEAQDA